MKILISDCATLTQNNDLSLTVFEKYGDVVYNPNISQKELLDTAAGYDMILCNKTIIDKAVIEKAKNLKYIGVFATGYNNIDIQNTFIHNTDYIIRLNKGKIFLQPIYLIGKVTRMCCGC